METRGAVACNMNVIATPNCGSKAAYLTCLTTYTKCKSYPGPKTYICTLVSGTPCSQDNSCYLQTNYSFSTNCTPTQSAHSVTGPAGGSAVRPSQLQ